MAMLDNLMLDIQRAYRTGKAGTGNVYSEEQSDILEQIQHWDHSFLPQERVVKDLCVELLRKAIKTIREGELTNAEGLIQTMHGLIRGSNLSQDSRLVCTSYIEAAAAYLDYKCQRYDGAMERLRTALVIDEQLEGGNPLYGYMHLHRMMLLDNWVRVLGRRGKVLDAIELAFQILDYLERKIPTLPLPTSWDSSHLAAYPADILSILFRTITWEIAEVVAGKDRLMSAGEIVHLQDVFTHACHHLSCDTSSSCYLSPASHDWIRMKQAALDENLPGFFQYATRLLVTGPERLLTLWYATVVEVINMKHLWPDSASEAFREEVARDIGTWRRLPPAWKALILKAE